MGILEEQARFLVAKYGTALGATGIARTTSQSLDLAGIMVLVGLLLFAAIMFLIIRDAVRPRATTRVTQSRTSLDNPADRWNEL